VCRQISSQELPDDIINKQTSFTITIIINMFLKKLFGSVSDKKSAQKDIDEFKRTNDNSNNNSSNNNNNNNQQPQQPQQPTTTQTVITNTTDTTTATVTSQPTPKNEVKTVADYPLDKLFERYLQVSQEEDITSDYVTVSGLIKFAEDLGKSFMMA
jgi:uncharacterized membrane protein